MTSNAQRIPPLPEEEWDDDARALIQSSWSGGPSAGHDFFKTMVRHRELFREWNGFGRAIFNGCLPPRDRELVVLRTAWLAQCRFEWAHHELLARRLGITSQEIQQVTEGADAPAWSQRDAALVRAVDELQRDSRICESTWQVLRTCYDDLQLIEIPILVGEYLLVAYFVNSMKVEPEAHLASLPVTSREKA
jgi:AhpD family alkylhydroperoxidase